jgi:hypothetical protein
MMTVPRWARIGLPIAGLVCLAIGALGGATNPTQFFQAYLMAYTFWLGLSLGCLGLAFIQFLTGGRWGLIARRIFEAGAAPLPLVGIVFLPLLLGLPSLYVWFQPAADPVLLHKQIYLNVAFFVVRAVLYFLSWLALAVALRRWSLRQDTGDPVQTSRSLQRLSIVGLLVLPMTVSFAAIDWWMSLEPSWFSTVYPATVCIADLLLALSFTIVVVVLLPSLAELAAPPILNDLGSLLLAFLMLWAYVTYFQYLLIWSGNLKEEITWFVRRAEGGWEPLAWTLAGIGFLLPFWLLLFRPLKRSRRWLAAVAALLIVMQIVHVYWLIQPAFTPDGPHVGWLQPLIWLGIGGLWLGAFAWSLGAAPLIAPHDRRAVSLAEVAHATA